MKSVGRKSTLSVEAGPLLEGLAASFLIILNAVKE